MLNLQNKRVAVIGGGSIAERKVRALLPHQPELSVVSPEVTPGLAALHEEGTLVWQKRAFHSSDVLNCFFVVAAAPHSVNEEVARAVHPSTLLNVASDASLGNATIPAFEQAGSLTLALSTNGASPAYAKQLTTAWAAQFTQQDEAYVAFLRTCRQLLKTKDVSAAYKREQLIQLLDPLYKDVRAQEQLLATLHALPDQ